MTEQLGISSQEGARFSVPDHQRAIGETMKKILLILLLSASGSACVADVDEPATCYPVDDSCAACGAPAWPPDDACFAQRVVDELGCGQCAVFRCSWPPTEAIEYCSDPCP